jgi:hypothetical protein
MPRLRLCMRIVFRNRKGKDGMRIDPSLCAGCGLSRRFAGSAPFRREEWKCTIF